MPRLTVIYAEDTFKEDYRRYVEDPGVYQSPEDFCRECFSRINVGQVALRNGISLVFALGQVNDAYHEFLKDDVHPDYEDGEYSCVQCGVELTNEDN